MVARTGPGYAAPMGPSNPWSPDWRPDPTGHRLRTIRLAHRGGVLAGLAYLPIGIAAISRTTLPVPLAAVAVAVGLPGVALLGAGLAPAALGSRIDALAVGLALALGAPVAATTSLVIGGWVVDGFVAGGAGLAQGILRGAVSAALALAPIVATAATAWVVAVRRVGRGANS